MRLLDRCILIWHSGIVFATLGPGERRAKVEAARARIKAAEERRRESERLRKLARANKLSTNRRKR